MRLHFFRLIAITILIIACMFFPYTPGDYDSLSVTLSTMAQLSGMSGLLLVPVGILWLIHETARRRKKMHANKTTYRFAVITIVASCVVAMVTSLGAFVNNNRSFGIITLLVCIYIFTKVVAKLRQMKKTESNNFNPTPFYLICIPTVAVVIRFMFIIPATEFSRNYAIRQSEKLIHDIEAYQTKNGHYPSSLLSLWKDYQPKVIGIKQYHYEPFGNAYNVYFEQFSSELGIKEIVMYNKLDEHDFSSHDTDLLVLTPDEINLQRGYIAVHDLPNPHWKYFWFD